MWLTQSLVENTRAREVNIRERRGRRDTYARSIFMRWMVRRAFRTFMCSLSLSWTETTRQRVRVYEKACRHTVSMSLTLRLSSLYFAWYLTSSAPAPEVMAMGLKDLCFERCPGAEGCWGAGEGLRDMMGE